MDLRTEMLSLLRDAQQGTERDYFDALEKRVPGSRRAAIDLWNDFHREGLINFDLDRSRYYVTSLFTNASTEAGRDPNNPPGYLAHIDPWLPADGVARSYVEEALQAFRTRNDRAAAFLVGAAMESLTLRLAATVKRIGGTTKKLGSRNIREVNEGIRAEIAHVVQVRGPTSMASNLTERWDGLRALSLSIRANRNELGHPPLLAPIAHDDVQAMFFAFSHLTALLHDLGEWLDPGTWRTL